MGRTIFDDALVEIKKRRRQFEDSGKPERGKRKLKAAINKQLKKRL